MAWSDAARQAAAEARRRRTYGYLTHYITSPSIGSVKVSEVPVSSAAQARRLTSQISKANPGDASHFTMRLRAMAAANRRAQLSRRVRPASALPLGKKAKGGYEGTGRRGDGSLVKVFIPD